MKQDEHQLMHPPSHCPGAFLCVTTEGAENRSLPLPGIPHHCQVHRGGVAGQAQRGGRAARPTGLACGGHGMGSDRPTLVPSPLGHSLLGQGLSLPGPLGGGAGMAQRAWWPGEDP